MRFELKAIGPAGEVEALDFQAPDEVSAVKSVEDFLDEGKRICVEKGFSVERAIIDTQSCLAVLLLDEDYRETPGTVGSVNYSSFQEFFDFL